MVTISGQIPDWQRKSLEAWFGAWLALGCMLIYGAATFQGSERTFYLICMGFWSFFALRAWRAVRWRRNGLEVIQLSGDGLTLRMDHGQRHGNAMVTPLEHVESAEVLSVNARSFLESMDQQFWVVGGDRIQLRVRGRIKVFGKQLPPEEAAQLVKVFNAKLSQFKKRSGESASSTSTS